MKQLKCTKKKKAGIQEEEPQKGRKYYACPFPSQIPRVFIVFIFLSKFPRGLISEDFRDKQGASMPNQPGHFPDQCVMQDLFSPLVVGALLGTNY